MSRAAGERHGLMQEPHPFRELLQEYVGECLPLVDTITEQLLACERRWGDGAGDPEPLRLAAGPLHTVKGNSAMMGLPAVQGLVHALEDAVALLRRESGVRTAASASQLLEWTGLLTDAVREAPLRDEWSDVEAATGRVRRWVVDQVGGLGPTSSGDERRLSDRRMAEAPDASPDTVRVDFRRLDELLEVLGEALIGHSALSDVAGRVRRRVGHAPDATDLEQTVETLGRTLRRLERAVMQTRLLPIATVFGRFPRVVRDLARSEQKQVELILTGGDALLDKTILDRLGEPLVHLLTNAVVHGVESAADRVRAGKPAEARLELTAVTAGGRAMLTLRDDGRGLDHDRIRARAREGGVDTTHMDEAQLAAFIFMPNFSTADRISELAGRGVGLDVVARSIRSLNGTIDVSSDPGRGATFSMSLPLSLVIVRSLVVEVDRERYAIPIDQVAETVRVAPDDIHHIRRQGVTAWRRGMVSIADGGVLLGSPAMLATHTEPVARRYCVVLGVGLRRRGLLVDR
ncbi:MAG: Hpt domain-containing protein, partial [Gemmatimonadales bacterium]|nr:Hpt domain-containing protein [Gemmatimonadales bacterium]